MTSTRTTAVRRGLAVAAALLAVTSVAACSGDDDATDGGSGSGSATGSAADLDAALEKGGTLTYWTWTPSAEAQVAAFEKAYPKVDVKLVNAGTNTEEYTKLQNAVQAGSGAPDVVQIEYYAFPQFALSDALLDLHRYGLESLESTYTPSTWSSVNFGGKLYGLPQDSGPMAMFYNATVFEQYGIAVPKTWDEFAAAAKKLHAAAPDVYLTNLASNQNGVWMGLVWQAGGQPFETTGGDSVKVAVNDETSKKLGDYWQGLIQDGSISTDPDFTDAWFQGLARGKYATWLTAAWGPVFLTGSAKGTSGKWRAAPLPQWDAAKQASGNWGGSTTAVIKGTKNAIAAAKFAEFLNTNAETTNMFATEQFLFPATKALLSDPSFTGQKPAFYGGQQVNQVFADVSATVDDTFQWPPFLDQAVTDWDETVGKSFADKGDVGSALDDWQQRTTDYAENQGFKVTE